MKICNKCKQEKVLSSFSKSSANKDGLTTRCKECDKEYYDTNHDKIIEYRKKYKEERAEIKKEKQLRKEQAQKIILEEKLLKKAEKMSTKDDRAKLKKREYREKNKEAIAVKRKEYREKNKEKISEQKRLKYHLENHERVLHNKKERTERREKTKEQRAVTMRERREKTKEQRAVTMRDRYNEYRANNIEKVREYDRIKKAKRLEKDPLYKLRVYTGTAIANVLSRKSYKKTSNTSTILGCTFAEFYLYIENQFIDEMSWDNRHLWHLDHIIPVSFAESEEELIKLNHYSNFRPLWKKDNQYKAAKLTEEALLHPIYLEIVSP